MDTRKTIAFLLSFYFSEYIFWNPISCYSYVKRLSRSLIISRNYATNTHFFVFVNEIGASPPKEVRKRFSIKFAMKNCKSQEEYKQIRSAFQEAFLRAIRSLPEYQCFKSGLCKVEDVNVPGCEKFEKRSKRSMEDLVTIKFTLLFVQSGNFSTEATSLEKAEASVFQLQYTVKTGQFIMNVSGRSISAHTSSLQHISDIIFCDKGHFLNEQNITCGRL